MERRHDVRLSVHHVGARFGSRNFPVLPAFERDVVNVLYDADEDCVAQIEERSSSLPSELHVLPYCLAAERGTATLTITYDPFASSLYEQNHAYDEFTHEGQLDYVFGEALRPVERRVVETTTLDAVVREEGIPPPDFLSANIQGAEQDLLLGAEASLRGHTVGVGLETEFHALYEGQKLFGDLSAFLDARGFHFARFGQLFELAPVRVPLGLRGPGFHSYAYAIFLRKLEDVDRVEDDDRRYLLFRKLAFVSLACGQLDYALAALDRSASVDVSPELSTLLADATYDTFLDRLRAAARSMPQTFPPTFAETYTLEASRARFVAAAPAPTPSVRPTTAARLRYVIGERRRRLRERFRPPRPATIEATPVEQLLREHGFGALADTVADRRTRS